MLHFPTVHYSFNPFHPTLSFQACPLRDTAEARPAPWAPSPSPPPTIPGPVPSFPHPREPPGPVTSASTASVASSRVGGAQTPCGGVAVMPTPLIHTRSSFVRSTISSWRTPTVTCLSRTPVPAVVSCVLSLHLMTMWFFSAGFAMMNSITWLLVEVIAFRRLLAASTKHRFSHLMCKKYVFLCLFSQV